MQDAHAPRPSVHSVGRLRSAVGAETADLRTRLEQALVEAQRLEAAGRTDLAVAVLEEQRATLLQVHERLERLVAGAMVEHEAEVALRAAATVPATPAVGPLAPAPTLVGRMLASVAAAVTGIALLVLPTQATGTLGMAATGLRDGADAGDASVDPGVDRTTELGTSTRIERGDGATDGHGRGAGTTQEPPPVSSEALRGRTYVHDRPSVPDEDDGQGEAPPTAGVPELPSVPLDPAVVLDPDADLGDG